jgi:hypothetical protein
MPYVCLQSPSFSFGPQFIQPTFQRRSLFGLFVRRCYLSYNKLSAAGTTILVNEYVSWQHGASGSYQAYEGQNIEATVDGECVPLYEEHVCADVAAGGSGRHVQIGYRQEVAGADGAVRRVSCLFYVPFITQLRAGMAHVDSKMGS